jgi:D-aminoacyl-tRNA deacylase
VRLVIQRVKSAGVRVDGAEVGRIGPGLLVLAGVARDDTAEDIAWLARKAAQLRIFSDAEGRMNLDLAAVGGAMLVVSQFTLYADCRKGNRPSYLDAAEPEAGRRGYEEFVRLLREMGHRVETGRFGAAMEVELINDGPVTIVVESRGRGGERSEQ